MIVLRVLRPTLARFLVRHTIHALASQRDQGDVVLPRRLTDETENRGADALEQIGRGPVGLLEKGLEPRPREGLVIRRARIRDLVRASAVSIESAPIDRNIRHAK